MSTRRETFLILLFAFLFAGQSGMTQNRPIRDLHRLMKVPKQYTALKVTGQIEIDGRADDADWSRSPWIDSFGDIATGASARFNTRCKMLWDDEHLYIYAEFADPHVWASITKHDASVFQDNAFEIFINPDGSAYNYFEIQINALNTIWDLFMPRPYRNGGRGLSSWNSEGLQHAVHICGSLNQANDRDTGWSMEMAIPFQSLGQRKGTVSEGTIWRMNLSRVQWEVAISDETPNPYTRKRDTATGRMLQPDYIVWSPQGLVDLHYPERYGYVLFSTSLPEGSFLDPQTEDLKLALWRYYYLQHQYRIANGRFASTKDVLDQSDPNPPIRKMSESIRMFVNENQFLLHGAIGGVDDYLSLDHKGEILQKSSSEKPNPS